MYNIGKGVMLVEPIQFGLYLKSLREQRGLTMRELDKRSGVSHSYISKLESGIKGIPSPDILRKIADPLGVDYHHLLARAGHLDFMDEVKESSLQHDDFAAVPDHELKENDLGDYLYRPHITYRGHLLTHQDKKLIKIYLDTLFSNQLRED
jgi:transcriptional regulator with XRE-family HTH domain